MKKMNEETHNTTHRERERNQHTSTDTLIMVADKNRGMCDLCDVCEVS